jgi:four helix bundle protein
VIEITATVSIADFQWPIETSVRDQTKQLQERTRNLAIRVVRLIRALPNCLEAPVIARQLLRSSTSVAANYRAACKARSTADFISKLGIVEEESDETVFWLEFIVETGLVKRARMLNLIDEAKQITAIFAASRSTAKKNNRQSKLVNRKFRNGPSHD